MSESGLKLIPQRFQNSRGFAAYYKVNRSGMGFMKNSIHPWLQGIRTLFPREMTRAAHSGCFVLLLLMSRILLLAPTLPWRNRTSGQRKPLWNTVRFGSFDLCKQKTISEMSVLRRQVGMIHMWDLNVLSNDYFQEKWVWLAVCMNSGRKAFQ